MDGFGGGLRIELNGHVYWAKDNHLYDPDGVMVGRYEVDHAVEQVFIDVLVDGVMHEVEDMSHQLYFKHHNNPRELFRHVAQAYEDLS